MRDEIRNGGPLTVNQDRLPRGFHGLQQGRQVRLGFIQRHNLHAFKLHLLRSR